MMLPLFALILWGAGKSLQNTDNAPILWLPEDYKPRMDYGICEREFHTLQSLFLTWPGCKLEDERLSRLAAELKSDGRSPSGVVYADYIKDVVTIDTLIDGLAAEREDKPQWKIRKQIIRSMQGTLVGPDEQTTGALVVITRLGSEEDQATVDTVLDAAVKVVGLPREQLRITGSPVEGAAIDMETARSLNYAIPSMIVSVIVCCLFLRSVSFTAVTGFIGAFGAALVLALVYAIGARMNAVLMVMAPLVFVLTVSASVHLVNYYYDAVRRGGRQGAAGRALAMGWLPCTLAAVTTAVGLGSLMVSIIAPVFQFGMLSMIGVITTLILLLLALPGVMQFVGRRAKDSAAQGRRSADSGEVGGLSSTLAGLFSKWWAPVVVGFVVIMAASAWGLFNVKTSVNVTDLFDTDSKILQDYRWTEENIGPLIPIEVLVRVDPDCPMTVLEQIELIKDLENRIKDDLGIIAKSRDDGEPLITKIVPGGSAAEAGILQPGDEILRASTEDDGGRKTTRIEVRNRRGETKTYTFARQLTPTLSVATFVPSIPHGRGVRQAIYRRVLKNSVERQVPAFIQAGLVADLGEDLPPTNEKLEAVDTDDETTEDRPTYDDGLLWRITTRAPVMQKIDYGQYLKRLELRVEDLLAEREIEGVSATYTGLTPVVEAAQKALLEDLLKSFFTATLLVWLVMTAVLRNPVGALVVMFPNVFPALVLFGGMGWFGQAVDIGTVMTASVALGIAVDDTLHFLTWFRRELDNGHSPRIAVAKSFGHCAKAMFQTTAICGIGLLILALSGFVPTRRFAQMMFALLFLALAGDLIFLPALLAGPAGRLFRPRKKSDEVVEPIEEVTASA